MWHEKMPFILHLWALLFFSFGFLSMSWAQYVRKSHWKKAKNKNKNLSLFFQHSPFPPTPNVGVFARKNNGEYGTGVKDEENMWINSIWVFYRSFFFNYFSHPNYPGFSFYPSTRRIFLYWPLTIWEIRV